MIRELMNKLIVFIVLAGLSVLVVDSIIVCSTAYASVLKIVGTRF
jgi:hypothetical protein